MSVNDPRDELHKLIDRLADSDLAVVWRVVSALTSTASQAASIAGATPLSIALEQAPLDDEPETEEERVAVLEAHSAFDRHDVISDDELRREFGL